MNRRQVLILVLGLAFLVVIARTPNPWRMRTIMVSPPSLLKETDFIDGEAVIKPGGKVLLSAIVVLLSAPLIYKCRTVKPQTDPDPSVP